MKALLLALAGVALLGASVYLYKQEAGVPAEVMDKFNDWKEQYSKSYADPALETYRLSVFHKNLKKIERHNAKNAKYTLGENQFMDLTKKEFKDLYLGYTKKANTTRNPTKAIINEDINWVDKGAVSQVKNQGMCGSCWAFSTTGNVEGVNEIKTGTMTEFSEQQLVDCSTSYGNMGCNGGLMDYGFEYIIAEGICTEEDYPYAGVDQDCKTTCTPSKVISTYTDVAQQDCDALAKALEIEPISIAVDAEEWQFYSHGIFDNCGTDLDHGVLLVGVTSEYWLVKNSWDKSWGMKGYIELKGGENTCGLCNQASYSSA